jgi:hypothetical protein
MSAAGSRFDLAARWRYRDKTFEHALMRHVIGAFVSAPVTVCCMLLSEHADDHSLEIAIGIAGVAGCVLLARWFGRGRILLGFWLWLLSVGVCGSILTLGNAVRELLIVGVVAPDDRAGYGVVCVIAVGLFALCWFGLKKAEARL